MNYKIKITEENQAIVKRIEKENEVLFNVMEVMESLTDKLDIKPVIRVKM